MECKMLANKDNPSPYVFCWTTLWLLNSVKVELNMTAIKVNSTWHILVCLLTSILLRDEWSYLTVSFFTGAYSVPLYYDLI